VAISATLSFIIKPPPSLFGGLDDVETSIVGRIIYPGWGFIQQQVWIKHVRSTTRIYHLKAQRCFKARRRLPPTYLPPGDPFVFERVPPSNTFIFGCTPPGHFSFSGAHPPASGCTPPGTSILGCLFDIVVFRPLSRLPGKCLTRQVRRFV
jgi:hypothetical protein